MTDARFQEIIGRVKLSNPETLNVEGPCNSPTYSVNLHRPPPPGTPAFVYTCYANHVHLIDPVSKVTQLLLNNVKNDPACMEGVFHTVIFGKMVLVFLADRPVEVHFNSEVFFRLKHHFKSKRPGGCRFLSPSPQQRPKCDQIRQLRVLPRKSELCHRVLAPDDQSRKGRERLRWV